MYQVQITDAATGQPTTDTEGAAIVARCMNPTAPQFEEVDAEQGIWLVALRTHIENLVIASGGHTEHAGSSDRDRHFTVEIEMP